MGGINLSKKHGVNPSMIVCIYCGEPKGIALLGALPQDAKAPRQIATDTEPCDACAEKFKAGITFLEVIKDRQPTGRYTVITEEGFINGMKSIFTPDVFDSILASRGCHIEEELYHLLFGEVTGSAK